jgi:hypothetical protein
MKKKKKVAKVESESKPEAATSVGQVQDVDEDPLAGIMEVVEEHPPPQE